MSQVVVFARQSIIQKKMHALCLPLPRRPLYTRVVTGLFPFPPHPLPLSLSSFYL
jgi:hypothetical protein